MTTRAGETLKIGVGDGLVEPNEPLWPTWFLALARRIAALEHGKAYDVLLILPDGEGAPSWAVEVRGKVESEARRRNCRE